jgi:2-ketoarginine methyltransferase
MTNFSTKYPRTFEDGLAEGLEPIRNLFLANVLQYLFTSGLYDHLSRGFALSSAEAEVFDSDRIAGLLSYLRNESIADIAPGTETYTLTERGRTFEPYRPWYELLVGGYGRTLDELDQTMRDPRVYASRDDAAVGRGSCGISRYDALPMIQNLLSRSDFPRSSAVADLGCGNGEILVELGKQFERVIGVDPSLANIQSATQHARDAGIEARCEFTVASAEDYMRQMEQDPESGVCFIISFALQEVLEQAGREAVVETLRLCLLAPGNSVVVVEVAPHSLDDEPMSHKLDLAYYNPYFLMHTVTNQRLESEEFWRTVFDDAGARIENWITTDPAVDSTGREFGVLLTKETTK